MSQDRTAERSHNTKMDNNSLERVEQFIYLGRTITNQNCIQEEIKSRLKSVQCYHSVQQLLSCILLSKNIKIEMYRNIIFPVVLYGCETWSLTLREERRLRVFKNRVLRRIFGPKRDEVTGEWRKLHNEELNDLYSWPNIIQVIKSRRMRWSGHVARIGEIRGTCGVLVGKPEGKRSLGRPRHIKMDLKKVGWEGNGLDWSGSGEGQVSGTCRHGNEPSGSIKCGNFLIS